MDPHKRKLPIGIQTFAKIREHQAFYYVDKTPHILKLVEQGSQFFFIPATAFRQIPAGGYAQGTVRR